MAKIRDEGERVVLELSWLEKIGAFHGNLSAPKSALVSDSMMETPWNRRTGMQGMRAPGTGIPGVIMLGTLRRKSGRDFAAVYGRGSARVLAFRDQPFARWIVTE